MPPYGWQDMQLGVLLMTQSRMSLALGPIENPVAQGGFSHVLTEDCTPVTKCPEEHPPTYGQW
jgi:hypothetical protein